MPRFMVIVKANDESEAGVMPSTEILEAMGRYNEELATAGVMLAGEGLHPSSKGKRLVFSKSGTKVVDGPFAETKELIAGFWLIQARSMEEAVEWFKRAPFAGIEDSNYEGEAVLEVRQVFEDDDFGAEFTPELREQEARTREQAATNR
ncbi:MAG: YciI family protein [Chloroflexota bacterium]|nr:YciI family protein [Chloroflexota bacterium]